MTTNSKQTANQVKVGDVVEFERGSPVKVLAIEENEETSPLTREYWGRSLIFDCTSDFDENGHSTELDTFYVRRELSGLVETVPGSVVR